MRRDCAVCGTGFDAKRANATYCGDTCRQRAKRSGDQPSVVTGSVAELACRAELEAAGRVDSYLGAIALVLAARLDATPGSGAAALAKDLRAAMDAALEGALVKRDEMDELQARRAAKRHAG